MPLIAISGGIGAGKSVLAKILVAMGYAVYDCDIEAKRLMDSDTAIHEMLCKRVHPRAVEHGVVNRGIISEVVFSEPTKLKALNEIVHGAVFDDLRQWRTCQGDVAFVESAILHSSGLIDMVDAEWRVTAPTHTRIERVCKRSGLTPDQVAARIHAQSAEDEAHIDKPLRIFRNSDEDSLLPQVHKALAVIKYQ